MNNKKFKVSFVIICFLFIKIPIFAGDIDSLITYPHEIIKSIENFNNDCVKDTLYCKQVSFNCWLPGKIKWGVSDTILCPLNIPDSLRRDSTIFAYPDNGRIIGSYLIRKIDIDTISDIVIQFRYFYQDSITQIDSLRFFAIFGGNSLQKLDTIDIFHIGRLQYVPFYVQELVIGEGISNCTTIQPYNYSSFQLDTIYSQQSIVQLTKVFEDVKFDNQNFNAYICPNPSMSRISVRLQTEDYGIYFIIIYDYNGNPCLNELVNIFQKEQYALIDIMTIPNGLYTIVIYKDKQIKYIEKIIKIN